MRTLTVAIAGLAILALASPAVALTQPQYIQQWGSYGTDLGQFKSPGWIDIHAGTVYVTDALNHRVETFTTGGTPIGAWGYDQMVAPYGIAVAANDTVYVVDEWRDGVFMYTYAGAYLGQFGSIGSGDGQFLTPHGVALDPSGNVYVADRENNRIQKFTSTGAFLAKWGTFGGGDGEFNFPVDVAVTGGNVYVVDLGNHRIQEFTTDGTFIRKWGSYGTGDGFLNVPYGITADASSRIYVADSNNSRVQIFDASGTFLTKWGGLGSGDGQFNQCIDAAVDGSGYVYVSDYGNDRVQKFTPVQEDADVPPAVASAAPARFRTTAWPNPSSDVVQLRFDLPAAGQLHAGIYDISGRLVRHVVDGAAIAGKSVFSWEGHTDSGERVPPGIYLARGTLDELGHMIESVSGPIVILR